MFHVWNVCVKHETKLTILLVTKLIISYIFFSLMDYNLIKKLAQVKGITIKNLAEMAGITEQGLHKTLKKETLQIAVLEKIASILGVPAAVFFEETNNIVSEHSIEYQSDWREKYYLLLEKYNKCLEEKDKAGKDNKRSNTIIDTSINK